MISSLGCFVNFKYTYKIIFLIRSFFQVFSISRLTLFTLGLTDALPDIYPKSVISSHLSEKIETRIIFL